MGWLTRQEAAALTEDQRLDYLTRTILGEAVGEGYTGMLVVAQVIHNRAMDGRWPSDPVAVAGQKNQFTTNSPGWGGNQGMVSANYGPGTKEYRMARAAARAAIIDQTVPDITGNAVHYHTIAMGYPSSWPSSIKANGFIDIGAHRVYPQHPVPPGEIPQKLASLQYVDGEVGSILSTYDERGIKPIRPATMSGTLSLQRELNRVAQQKANAPETIKRNRALAFGSTIDPFEVRRPSDTDLIINRPVPAMKESMQRQLRATGTVNTTERTFAQLVGDRGMDKPGLTLVSSVRKPPVVQTAPWGVRESVAANVAAADAAAGRGQIVMTGNPNIPGSVVDYLYPKIAEGEGDANQDGKGPRAVRPGQSTIERGKARPALVPQSGIERGASRPVPVPQSTIERGATPVVQRQPNGAVRVIPQSQIERPDMVQTSIKRANEANDPGLAASLAASIASRPASPVGKPPATRVVRSVPVGPTKSADRNTQSARDEQALARGPGNPARPRPATTVSQPAGSIAPKAPDRLPATAALEFTPAKPAGKLPTLPPPKSEPIGTMPKFGELAAFNQAPAKLSPISPVTPASVEDRERARKSTLFGTPQRPVVQPSMEKPELAVVPMPKNRPTTRPVAQAPTPAVRRPTTLAPTTRPPLNVLVDGSNTILPPRPVNRPRSLYYTDPLAFGNAAVSQSGDTSVGSQADAAAARASGDAWRKANQ